MTRFVVSSPDPSHSGVVAGVPFLDGRGEVDGSNVAALGYFRRRGYTVVPAGEPVPAVEVPADPPAGGDTEGGRPRRPAVNASKADWVDYAVALGRSREDAEQSTKEELIKSTKDEEAVA